MRRKILTHWVKRLLVPGAVGSIAVMSFVTAAGAVALEDEASEVEFAFACATMDNMSATLSFHVDAYDSTPSDRRLVSVQVSVDGVDDWEYSYALTPPSGYDFFVTRDYSFDIDILRSFLDGDALSIAIMRADGTIAASASATASCFDGSDGATVHDFSTKARLGVPRIIRLLEHVTYPGLDSDPVVKSRVTGATGEWTSGWLGTGVDDELALDSVTRTALGAALADNQLTLNPTAVGTYTLKWGVVTSRDYPWTGGSGDERGPATLTIEVIERPAPPAEGLIVEGARGPVSTSSTAPAGGSATVDVGSGLAGEYVDVWLRSDPVYLGFVQVPASGTFTVTLPASTPAGGHKVIVADELGGLIGWDDIRVTAAQNTVPRAATGLDEGAPTFWAFAAIGALGLAGAISIGLVRRRV